MEHSSALFLGQQEATAPTAAPPRADTHYRALFMAMQQACCIIEQVPPAPGQPSDYRYVAVNPAFTRHSGLPDATGQTLRQLVPGVEPRIVAVFDDALASGEPRHYEEYVADLGMWIAGEVLPDPQPGHLAVLFSNVTARRQAEQTIQADATRQAYLLALSDALQPVAEAAEIPGIAARLLGKHLQASQVYYADGETQGEGICLYRGYDDGLPPPADSLPARDAGEKWLVAHRAGTVQVVPDLEADASTTEAERVVLRQAHIAAYIAVPLVKAGAWVATLAVHSRAPRPWTASEVYLVQETAERTWVAVEHARAEAARRHSEEQFRLLVAATSDVVYRMGADWTQMKLLIGRNFLADNPDSTRTWEDTYIPADDQALVQATIAEAIRCKSLFELEHRVHLADGTLGWVYSRAVPVLDAQGVLTGWLGTAQDVTARKQAESSLHTRAAQQAFLVRLSDALGPLTDPARVQQVAAHLLGEHLAVDRAFYCEVTGSLGAERYQVEHVYHAPNPELVVRRYPLRPFGRWVAASQAGSPIVVADLDADPLFSAAERPHYHALQVQAWVGMPLQKQGRNVALLVVQSTRVRAWLPPELDLLAEVTERIWEAVARVRTQAALRQSEEKYRSLFEAIDEGFGIAEVLFARPSERPLDVRWLEANFQLAQLLGVPRAQLLSGSTLRQLLPELPADWLTHYAQVAGQGKPVRFEQYSASLGRWFEVQLFRVGGELPWRVAALFRDITDRYVAAQQLQEFASLLEHQVAERTQALQYSRDLLRTIAETQPASLRAYRAVRDKEGQLVDLECIFANSVSGPLAAGQLPVGTRYREAGPASEVASLWASYGHVVETGEVDERELAYPDGQPPGWYRSIATRLGDGLLVSSEDITARKLAGQARARALRLLEQSEEVARMGSWDYEPATGQAIWSAGMYRLYGLPPGVPVPPHPYLDYVIAADRPLAERLLLRLHAGPGTLEETLRLQVGDEVKTVRVKAVGLAGGPGQPDRVLGVDLDISDVQRLETENQALRLNQQQTLVLAILQAQEAERGRLAEALHNGLGQLLYAIKLQVGQLDVPALHALPALNGVRARADHLLADAIGQTRTLSHELMPTALARHGLAAALRDICRNLSTPQLQFTCHTWLDEQELPPPLQSALYRLAQELAHNIAKHAGASQATLEFEMLPGWLNLRAEDNGHGFDPAATARGLGLRLLHDAVNLLGGTILLDSSPEYGTHIRLRIPFTPVSIP